MLTQPDAPVLQSLLELVSPATPTTVSYATDAGWLQQLDLDCIIFGPGDIATAHRPNEFVPQADLVAVRAVLQRLIAGLC